MASNNSTLNSIANNLKSNSNSNSNSTESVGGVLTTLNFLISIIHTFVRFLPIGIYFFVYLSSALFKDLRSAYLLIGLVVNDLLGYLFRKYTKFVPNSACAVFTQLDDTTQPAFLPNPHTEVMAFISSFFFTDMFYKGGIDAIPFSFLLFMIFLTVWSRISIGCKNLIDVLFNLIFGGIAGTLFYILISTYYLEAEKGFNEKEKCDLGFDNYRCDEIKNGTVIIKEGSNNNEEDQNKDDEDE